MSTAKLLYFGFAHVWAGSARPGFLKTRVKTAHLSLTSFRISVRLIELPPFTKAFQLIPGDALHSESPCKTW